MRHDGMLLKVSRPLVQRMLGASGDGRWVARLFVALEDQPTYKIRRVESNHVACSRVGTFSRQSQIKHARKRNEVRQSHDDGKTTTIE